MKVRCFLLLIGLSWTAVAPGQQQNAEDFAAHCAELMKKPELSYRMETFDNLSGLDEMDACNDEPDVLHRRVCVLELRESRHRALLIALWTRFAMDVVWWEPRGRSGLCGRPAARPAAPDYG